MIVLLPACGGQGAPGQMDDNNPDPAVGGGPVGDPGVPDPGQAEAHDMGASHDLAAPHDLAMPPHDMAKPPPPPPPAKKVLSFTWEGESMYYYCGPSAARMALSTKMASPPSQTTLASYMGTDSNGTDDISLVKGALDHYLNISSYDVVYLPTDPPSAAQEAALKKALVASIDAGYGMVANIVAGWRPSFYPQSGTIYHYIALVGYDASGDKVLVADPAATGCGDGYCGSSSSAFANVPKSYWINTSDLAVWITPKGYTYHP
jgi:hypothetical protein